MQHNFNQPHLPCPCGAGPFQAHKPVDFASLLEASLFNNDQSSEDIILWSDATICLREDLPGMTHMSDDYVVIPYGSEYWQRAYNTLYA